MALNPKEHANTIQRLVREIGITEAQAIELVALLGSEWASLVREAKALMAKRSP
jgi:hypothetical protein